MPEIDKSPSEGINLDDPVPQGRSAISSRLRYTGYAVGVGICLAVVGGMSLRMLNQGATEMAKQNAHFAAEAAPSDRERVEKKQSTADSAKQASSAGTQGTPEQVASSSQQIPAAGGTHPELVHEADNSGLVQQQQAQIAAQEQARLDAERQAYQEEIAARKAPTSYQAYLALASTSAGIPETAAQVPAAPIAPTVPQFTAPQQFTGQSQGIGDLAALGQQLGITRNSNRTDTNYSAQNEQENKTKFLEGSEAPNPADDYLKATRVDPLSEFEIQQGSVIPAVMPLGLNSDTPGQVTAEIRVDVNDALCGVTRKDGSAHCYVLIPHGSKLIGEYNSNISYGQNRMQVVWTRVIFPDSTSLDLGRMNGHAADGSAGLKGKVDDHWTSKIAGVALTSVLSAGLSVSQNRSNNSVLQYPSTGEVIGASVGQSASQLGQELTQRNFNRQPTVVIRPGQKFLVYVKKDIVFPSPYEPHY